MAKIHITLVGGQPVPVYNGIMATHPDKVIYIYSTDSKPIVNNIKDVVNIEDEDLGTLDPTNPDKIYAAAKSLAEKYKDDEISLNISGGLKSWTYLFGKVFGEMPKCDVIYIDQNNMLWNYTSMTGKKLETGCDMHTLFRLYGNPIEANYVKFSDYTKADKHVSGVIENIRKRFPRQFKELTTVLTKEQNHKVKNISSDGFMTATGDAIQWDKSTGEVNLQIYKNGKIFPFSIRSPHAPSLVFNSGWFEFKVAEMLSHWDKAMEICLNCRFPFRPGLEKNEVDIIVNTGDKVLFVECKTKIFDSTDIDKFSSVVKTYGGTGSKALFVTENPMNDMSAQKCMDHKILTFALDEPHLGMDSGQAIARLLDAQLYNINIK